MAVAARVDSQACLPKSVVHSYSVPDINQFAAQFNRLKLFVSDSSSDYKKQVEQLSYPIFVHFFLEIVSNGNTSAAQKFYTKHRQLFSHSDRHRNVIETLAHLQIASDLQQSRLIQQFLHCKYSITLTEECLQYVRRFLKRDDCTLLLHVFSRHIQVTLVADDSMACAIERPESAIQSKPKQNGIEMKETVDLDSDALLSLKEIVSRVQQAPPPLPSICAYTLLNAYQGLCHAVFSSDHTRLCAAFEDASIRLWNLTSTSGDDDADSQSASSVTSAVPSSSSTKLNHGSSADISQSRLSTHATDSGADGGNTSALTASSRDASFYPDVNISQVHLAGDFPDDVQQKNSVLSRGADGCRVLRAHAGSVYSVAFSSDNQHLLSASDDTTIRLWNLATERNIAIYRGHNYPVWCVQSSPTDGYFASCSKDRCARLWSYDRVYPIRSFAGHTADVDVLQFHVNGTLLATASSDATVRLWSNSDGQCVRLLQADDQRGATFALAASPDGKLLAAAGEDKHVRVWDLGAGKLYGDYKSHTDTVTSLAFNRHSSMLVSGGMDGLIKCWDVRNSRPSTDRSTQPATHCPELLATYTCNNTTNTSSSSSSSSSEATRNKVCVHSLSFTAQNYLAVATSNVI